MKEIINIAKNNAIYVVGVFLLVYKALLLNYMLELPIELNTVLYTVVVSLLLMCPVINHKDKFAYIYLNIMYVIVTLIIYADFIYYTYSTNFLSFYQIENLKYIREIGSGLICIFSIKDILLFTLDNILLAIICIFSYKKTKSTFYNEKALKIVIIVFICIINLIVIHKNINIIYSWKSYNKSEIVQLASIYYYHYEDFKDYLSTKFMMQKVDEQELQKIYNENQSRKTKSTQYTGVAKDCNVIILQLESLNEYIIGKKVNGKEITPNLNKFFSENVYCGDMYNQGLGTTADSEFEMENSMYPLENGYVFQKYYDNNWLDIFTILKENGYYTSFMHPNTSTYWNREEVYKTGYHIDEYNDITKFEKIEKAGDFYSDEGFLDEAINIMDSYEEKFCATLVSVTNHIPFYLTGVSNLHEKVKITYDDLKEYQDEVYRNYIISCNFVDYAFGKFMKGLEETGLINNSILVVYGDHGAGLTCIDDIKRLYQENEIEYTDFEDATQDLHIPFGIKIPVVKINENIQRTVAKIDIKPTILDVLGIEDKFSIGDTIFSQKDYSFIKGLGYVSSKNYYINGRYYRRDDCTEIEENEEMIKLLNTMKDEIYLSDTIIKNDLINNQETK